MSAGWILSLVAIAVAVCALLAAMGFRGRVSTVGIDLGTTFSVVGVVNQHTGKVVIVQDKVGHRIFPSVVSYMDNGEIKVGYEAVTQLSSCAENTIYNAKRFIGRSLEDEQVKAYASQHPFRVVESSLSNHSKVGFQLSASGHGGVVTPEQVGTQVLKHLLALTRDYLGHSQVNKAVIAVPAKFTATQRQATAEAYRQAGLKVVRVMEEPTAAAVAYRLHKRTDIHHILVYDFGGGTLDVSLLYVAKGSVEVYATDGDDSLGGSDLDLCLLRLIKDRIQARTPADVSTADVDVVAAGVSIDYDEQCSQASLRTKAEDIKKQLTYAASAPFSCILAETPREVVRFEVTREDFEVGCAALFDRCMLPISRLLEDLGMERRHVDEVVLVGGSTRVPMVKKLLREYFQKEQLNDHIDPDVTVAYGAASVLD